LKNLLGFGDWKLGRVVKDIIILKYYTDGQRHLVCVPPLPEEDKIPMALALEECEQKYIQLDENKYITNSYFLKYLIPQIRRSENKLDIGEDEIVDGRQCMIINNGDAISFIYNKRLVKCFIGLNR